MGERFDFENYYQYFNFLPFNAFEQVSWLISDYLETHPGEMLPKTPEEIEAIYKKGLSVIAVNPDNPNQVIGHAALYPFGIKKILGRELLELGSFIVLQNFRGCEVHKDSPEGSNKTKLTISKLIVIESLKKAGENPVIATVKRLNTLYALQNLKELKRLEGLEWLDGFQPLSYSQYPMITSLTCVCPIEGNENGAFCYYHTRKPGEIINRSNGEPPIIACTLMGYNLDGLNEIENKLQQRLGLVGQALNHQFVTLARQRLSQLIVL